MKIRLKSWLGLAAVAALLTLLALSGALYRADLAVSDALYQQRSAADGVIVLVGIDQKAFDELGPYNQWERDIMARAVEALNQSEEFRPAVIGIDVLYSGETKADERLAEVAGACGNVLTASAAVFGDSIVAAEGGDYYLDTFSVKEFGEPYEALKQASEQGHINAMLDADGILRHHLLFLRLSDGTEIPSFALKAAQMYREACGQPPVTLPPVNGRGFWYVPFCGEPGDFYESISIADLLAGRISAERFAGKIVLIGPYASGLQDSYLTSADHARAMYGVEFQANAIQALLRGDYKREVGEGLQAAVLFILLLIALIGFWRRPVGRATVLWAAFGGGSLLLCLGLYRLGYVVHALWIPVGVTVLYAGCLAFNYGRAAMEKRRVTNTFKRYVAPEIVKELLKEGSDSLGLGGELKTIAVLFVDVRGFTPMSELLAPVQVVDILNRYLSLISECILKNGGTLDKFVGDAAMAFWGAPLPLAADESAMRAVRAAADMVRGSEKLSEELLRQYGRTVSFGIGIHLGEAVVGNIGSPKRMDYTAIGDTVNTAARLEANAPGGMIYLSRAVANVLGERIRTTSLGGTVRLKGKKEGFEVLVLDGIAGEEDLRSPNTISKEAST